MNIFEEWLSNYRPTIKVVGVGSAGQNAINNMIEEGLQGVDFIAVNTDQQALTLSHAPVRVQIGDKVTHGLGAGSNPELGERSAEESAQELYGLMSGADMVFVISGMGGGTGTGAAPVVARIAKEAGALTIGVVTRPFSFEGSLRQQAAEAGIAKLQPQVDSLLVLPMDRLMPMVNQRTHLQKVFGLADAALHLTVDGITKVITTPGLINIDIDDLRSIVSESGVALMAVGVASGEGRARLAAERAIAGHLVDGTLDGAQGILFNITGGNDLNLFEVNEVANLIRAAARPDCRVIFGAVVDPTMYDQLRVTVFGFSGRRGEI